MTSKHVPIVFAYLTSFLVTFASLPLPLAHLALESRRWISELHRRGPEKGVTVASASRITPGAARGKPSHISHIYHALTYHVPPF